MKNSKTPVMLSIFVAALAWTATVVPIRAQSGTQMQQTPSQADRAFEQDRNDAANVTVGRDWKAQEGNRDRTEHVDTDRDHETVGRDWRAHFDRSYR